MTGLEILAVGYMGAKIAMGVGIVRHYFSGEVQEICADELAAWLVKEGGTRPLVEVVLTPEEIAEDEKGLSERARDILPDWFKEAEEKEKLEGERELEEQEQQEKEGFMDSMSRRFDSFWSSTPEEPVPEVDHHVEEKLIDFEVPKDEKGEEEGAIEQKKEEEQGGVLDSLSSWWSGDSKKEGEEEEEEKKEEEIENVGPIQLVDVRTEYEYNSGHIPGAVWLSFFPPWSLKYRVRRLGLDPECVIVPICWTAHRSIMCCKVLKELGFRAKHLQGGMLAWRKEELPEVAGEAPETVAPTLQAE